MKAMMDLMKTMNLMAKPWRLWLGILIAANMLMPILFIQSPGSLNSSGMTIFSTSSSRTNGRPE